MVACSHEERLVGYFLEVALGSEHGSDDPIIRKWPENSRIQVIVGVDGSITRDDEETLAAVIEELNELISASGTRLVRVDPTSGSGYQECSDIDSYDIKICFGPQSKFADIDPEYVPGSDGFVTVWWWDHGDNLGYAHTAIVPIDNGPQISQTLRSHLIREELTQAMGLLQDSELDPESVFFQGFSRTTQYTALDRDVIRLLYHPLVRPGMDRAELAPVLRQLVESDYIAGVDRSRR